MSDDEAIVDMFQEAVDPAILNAPKHHSASVERPNGRGTLEIRMVKKHVLWGDHLWNAGRWLSGHFDENPAEVAGLSVVELGAGAGLPSVVAALNGAKCTVVTDYPDPELVENLAHNLRVNLNAEAQTRATATGYLWGASTEEILKHNNGQKFDVVILCDLLFNHSEHTRLWKSCEDLLAPTGHIWCVFTHYLPDRIQKDLKFLEMAPEYGFVVEGVGKHLFGQVMFENDRGDPEVRRTCHITKIRRIHE